ncbi:uncharacterized protein V1510DRAFT_374023 [Dipodascopsis tothii]|uniref:uncharacterized protein n=1 Tax=Dipodascopsis tothii TaxID=44089 RepID=UPI0034CD3064
MSDYSGQNSPESVTALDVIASQEQLENEALEVMPFDPTHCTYFDGELRQSVFACLTCAAKSETRAGGICYSCSIQCHSEHDLVELFNKRDFVCDCGTTRLRSFGGCNLRRNFDELAVPSSSNRYCHNFAGRFCACDREYDVDAERGTMYQCLLGDVCNEDWYHAECIMGVELPGGEGKAETGTTGDKGSTGAEETEAAAGTNEAAGANKAAAAKNEAAAAKNELAGAKNEPAGAKSDPAGANNEPAEPKHEPTHAAADVTVAGASPAPSDDYTPPAGFPDEDSFEAFICWKCVDKHKAQLGRWAGWEGVALDAVVRGGGGRAAKRRLSDAAGPAVKRTRTDDGALATIAEDSACKVPTGTPPAQSFSLFLVDGWRERLCGCPDCAELFGRFPYLRDEEDTYEPPQDEDPASLLESGARALSALPHAHAVETIHGYNQIKERLATFLRPFAADGTVVTERDVRQFFDQARADRPLGL